MPPVQSENKPTQSKSFSRFFDRFNGSWLHVFQQYFFVIVAVVAVLVAAVSWWFIVRPAWQERAVRIEERNQADEQLASEIARYNTQIANVQEVIERYENVREEDMQMLARMVPAEPQTEALFAELHAIVEQNGLSVGTIAIESSDNKQSQGRRARQDVADSSSSDQENEVPKGVETLQVSLSVSSLTYESFKSLLRSFERHIRLLDVESVSFSPEGGEGEFVIRTYYRKPAETAEQTNQAAGGVVPDATISQP